MGLNEKIWISPYQLKSRETLNARSGRQVFEGALIRIGSGFSCLHPWPELGDPELKECLEDLNGRRSHPLVRKSLFWLEADAVAREEGRSLFEGKSVARSHATLPVLSEEIVAEAVAKGFTHVKSKAGRHLIDELEAVRTLGEVWPDLKWRIDFNGLGDFQRLSEIFSKWSNEELARIDFLEDPMKGGFEHWDLLSKETGIAMAHDRYHREDEGNPGVVVLKPAVDVIESGPGRRVVTSYMDHAVGQSFAAWESLKVDQVEIFGLQTHGLFEPDDFFGLLGEAGPEFAVPEGTGVGFDDLLHTVKWCVL